MPDERTQEDGAPDASGADLLRIAREQLAYATDCLGWKGGHRHKGVHLGRKSIRRVRSILALAEVPLGPDAQALGHSLSQTNQALSRARDAQALVEAIDHFSKQKTRDDKWRALLGRARGNAVAARREVLKEEMAEDPDFQHLRAELGRLSAALGGLPWNAVTVEGLQSAFSHSRKRTRKAAKRAMASGQNEDWHHWRRKARRQSQQKRLLGEIGIKSSVRYDDKEIAVLLGQQQDCSLLLDFCESGHSPIRWVDRNQLHYYIDKKLRALRKSLAHQSVHA